MKRAIQYLRLAIDRICSVCWQIAGAATVLMALVISYNVTRRYLFNQQDPYAYVATCILMLVSVVFALAQTQNLNQHLRVNLLDRRIPKTMKAVIQKCFSPLVGLICISIVTWKSWTPAWMAFETGDTFGSGVARLVTWPSRMVVVFGAGLLGLVLIAQILHYFFSLRDKAGEPGTGNSRSQ